MLLADGCMQGQRERKWQSDVHTMKKKIEANDVM